MKKVFSAMAVLVAMGMSFVGCVQDASAVKKSDNNAINIQQKELPANVGENPFKGNTYGNGKGEYVFTENEVTEKFEGKVQQIYSYAYDSQKKLLALKVKKLPSSIKPAELVTPEQYINEAIDIISSEQKYRTHMEQINGKPMSDKEWQKSLNMFKNQAGLPETASYQEFVDASKAMLQISIKVNYYYSYDFEGSSLKLKNYVNPELSFKQYYTDYEIPNFYWYDNELMSQLSVSGKFLFDNQRSYIIADVTDTVIKIKESVVSKTTVDIPYTMTTGASPKLTLTINNKSYTLSLNVNFNAYAKQ